MEWLTYIPIVVTGAGAVLAALLNTHQSEDGKPQEKFRRNLNVVGWVTIALTVGSTAAGIGISANNLNAAHEAKAEKEKETQRADRISEQLTFANDNLTTQGETLKSQSATIENQTAFIREEAQRAATRAASASMQLSETNDQVLSQQKSGTEMLKQQQQFSEANVTRAQKDASEKLERVQTDSANQLKEEGNKHQADLRFQQDLLMASLLGQQSERPQVRLMLDTTLEIRDPELIAFFLNSSSVGGGALAPLIFDESYDKARKNDFPISVEAEFAELKAAVRNPFEETVAYGWTARLLTGNSPTNNFAITSGGPHALSAPKPEFTLEFNENTKRILLNIHSRLRNPLNSALIYQGLNVGEKVAEMGLNTKGLTEAEIQSLIARSRKAFRGGKEWTLINGNSGLCASANVGSPSVEFDPGKQMIMIRWLIDERNKLQPCPADMFMDLREIDK